VLVRPGGAAKATLANGTLVYERGETLNRLVIVDHQGRVTPLVDEPRAFFHPRWSPDGSRLAVAIAKSGVSNIWVMDRASRTFSQLTSTGINASPEWAPDGTRIMYRSIRPEGQTIQWQRADGGDPPTTLVNSERNPYGATFSPDGKWVMFRTGDFSDVMRHVLLQRRDSTSALIDLTPSGLQEFSPRISPDGKWLAASALLADGLDVFVRPFPNAMPRYRVSLDGGVEPMWSRDGRTLYYRNGRSMIAATFAPGPAFAIASRAKLFEGLFLSDASNANYDVMPDGKGFIMVQIADTQTETIVIWNWATELRAMWGK
jgi:eukaryotic-like serine/threonine-protein kinase